MPTEIAPLVQLGAVGATLWYILTRINPALDGLRDTLLERMDQMTVAINENTKAALMVALASAGASEELKRIAKGELEALSRRESGRTAGGHERTP